MREPLALPPSAADLLDAPERGLELAPAEAAAMLARLEGAAAVLRVAAARTPALRAASAEPSDEAPGTWLGVDEVAQRLGLTKRATYRRKGLPWSRALGGGTLRMRPSDLDTHMRGKRR